MQLASVLVAAVAALGALAAVFYSGVMVREARRAHQDETRDWHRQRLERVAELVEHLQRDGTLGIHGFSGNEWEWTRVQLLTALVGLRQELPKCAQAADASTVDLAATAAQEAREEVAEVLIRAAHPAPPT
jgi:hypothetical protein